MDEAAAQLGVRAVGFQPAEHHPVYPGGRVALPPNPS